MAKHFRYAIRMAQEPKTLSALPLCGGILAFVWFGIHIFLGKLGSNLPLYIGLAIPPVLLSGFAFLRGWGHLRVSSDRKGLGIGTGLVGTLGLTFWIFMVPLIAFFALPALEQDDTTTPLEQRSQDNMRILIRHIKTFHRREGRMPVKLEELVDRAYAPVHLLYDPRDPRKDAPGYRLRAELPSDTNAWTTVPALEGRWPNKDGRRLIGTWNEKIHYHDDLP